jgi:hypothetical protein
MHVYGLHYTFVYSSLVSYYKHICMLCKFASSPLGFCSVLEAMWFRLNNLSICFLYLLIFEHYTPWPVSERAKVCLEHHKKLTIFIWAECFGSWGCLCSFYFKCIFNIFENVEKNQRKIGVHLHILHAPEVVSRNKMTFCAAFIKKDKTWC